MNESKINWFLYIPLYALFFAFLLFQSRGFSEAQDNPISLMNLNRFIGISSSIIFILGFFLMKEKINISIPITLKFYSIYLVIGIISTILFSEWLLYSFWKLAEIFAVFIFSVYVWNLSYRSPIVASIFYERIVDFFKFLLIATVLNIIFLPGSAIQPPVSSREAFLPFQFICIVPQINPNSLGLLSAVVLFISLIRFLKLSDKKIMSSNLIWMLFAFLLLIFAQSRTSILSLFIALCLSILLFRKLHFIMKGLMYLLLILSIYLYLPYIVLYLKRGSPETLIMTMSGRTTMWDFAMDYFWKSDLINKILGSGFAISNRLILQRYMSEASTLHSDYIDALISTGITGLVFLSLFLVFNLYKTTLCTLKNKSNSVYIELFGVSIILTLRTITGPTISFLSFFLPLFLIIPIYLSRMNQFLQKLESPIENK